ncbi:MAG: vanadium-dependent haloperoxidase [Planctomycetes bacterium]|nr:vanadium-dependent haloperoxidase [Planctomycetota bacterium]
MTGPHSFGFLTRSVLLATLAVASLPAQHSIARQWNELLLDSIRLDFARPTVHARNLYHVSVAMWDAWATYDPIAQTVIFDEDHATTDPSVDTWRHEAISYACWNILHARFDGSPGSATMAPQYDALMQSFGYATTGPAPTGNTPAGIGYRIAQAILAHGAADHSNEAGGYANLHYLPANQALVPDFPGNPLITDPNRWQPLSLLFFVDQSGNPIPWGYPEFLGPEWGQVTGFALSQHDLSVYERDGFDYWVFHDPGAPPYIGTATGDDYKWGFEVVSVWSSHLDPADGVMIDASPASIGSATLPNTIADYDQFYDFTNGGDSGTGHALNPVTGQPYTPQIVPRGDYARILAEFWADGPASETPPGHWFTILNYVSDHPQTVKQLGGTGPVLGDLEWDVKCYLAMGGAMHDSAISAWGVKGWYDYLRPISAIRYMADQGQSSDMLASNYDPDGIRLYPGLIETVTLASAQPGQRHAHLALHVGKIAVNAWRGPSAISDPATDVAGVGWILAENWWPYQRPSFVTPPFAGYVSGHSTFSRAAAVVMDRLTGSPYFPGGMGEFFCPQNEFLVFEDGPSVDVTLQWATYYDASDQCSLSRIWGGIHPPGDDIPGRKMGQSIGEDAHALAEEFWNGQAALPALVTNYGLGCAGSNGTPRLDAVPSAMPVLGSTLELAVSNLPLAATNGWVALGSFKQTPLVDLSVIGMPSCTFDVFDPFATIPVAATNGSALYSLDMPSDPWWLGRSLYHQALAIDLGANALGITTSVSADTRIGR